MSTRTLKRTNFTTEEVIKILQGCKISDAKGDTSSKFCTDHNDAIDGAISTFYDYLRPADEFGAMAYCPEEDVTYHIGTIPEEDLKSPKTREYRVRQRTVAESSLVGTELATGDAQVPSQ